MSTLANNIKSETEISQFARAYLAITEWLLVFFNNERRIIHRLLILLVYLEMNPRPKIIENINNSNMVLRAGLISMSLEQAIFNPSMRIEHAIILVHLFVIAIFVPNKLNVENIAREICSF